MYESISKNNELEMRWVWIWATDGIQTNAKPSGEGTCTYYSPLLISQPGYTQLISIITGSSNLHYIRKGPSSLILLPSCYTPVFLGAPFLTHSTFHNKKTQLYFNWYHHITIPLLQHSDHSYLLSLICSLHTLLPQQLSPISPLACTSHFSWNRSEERRVGKEC